MRNNEDNRAAQAEASARIQIKFVMDYINLLDYSRREYARHLYNQKEPYHPYKSKKGNHKHQLYDVENLYEKVWSKTKIGQKTGTIKPKEEKYVRIRRY